MTITYLITCAVTGSRDDLLGLIGLIPISVLLLGLSIKDINFKDNGLYSMITRFYQTILPCWFGFSFMATMFSGFSSGSITQLAIIYFPFFILLPIAIFHLTFKLAYPTLLKNRKCHPTEAISYAVLQTLCNLQLILMPIDKLPLVINKSKDNSITINCHDDKYMSTQWTPYSKKCFKNTYMNVFYQDNTKYLVKLKNFDNKYLNVPNIFTENKKSAETFVKNLEIYFGEVELISTTEKLGKRELLKARYNQFINAQVNKKRFWKGQ